MQGCNLGSIPGNDPLADFATLDPILLTIGVQQLPAADTQRFFERIGRVVQPRVDDLAVSRRGLSARGSVPVEEQGVAGKREGGSDGKANDAGANDLA